MTAPEERLRNLVIGNTLAIKHVSALLGTDPQELLEALDNPVFCNDLIEADFPVRSAYLNEKKYELNKALRNLLLYMHDIQRLLDNIGADHVRLRSREEVPPGMEKT